MGHCVATKSTRAASSWINGCACTRCRRRSWLVGTTGSLAPPTLRRQVNSVLLIYDRHQRPDELENKDMEIAPGPPRLRLNDAMAS